MHTYIYTYIHTYILFRLIGCSSHSLKKDCLDAHNEYRAKHEGTPSMVWSDHLAHEAQKWADKIAKDGKAAHAPALERKGQGENLAACKGNY